MTGASRRRQIAIAGAEAGAQRALRAFRDNLVVETKGNEGGFVTDADRAAQQKVIEEIRSEFAGEAIVAEEGKALNAVPESGTAWVIDPIDGTVNYLRETRIWTTSVASIVDGKPVAAASVMPAMGDVYATGRCDGVFNDRPLTVSDVTEREMFVVGVPSPGPAVDQSPYVALDEVVMDRFGALRRFGSTQSTLAFVASGELDAAIVPTRPHPWDSIAGVHLIERAGGTVTDATGKPWEFESESLVASNDEAHNDVIEAISDKDLATRSHTSAR